MQEEISGAERIKQEEQIRERENEKGKWQKVYFGGGVHFQNWLGQCKEIYSEENLEIEEVDPAI